MPTVPETRGPRVSVNPINAPALREQRVNFDPDAFGAATGAGLRDAGNVLAGVARQQQETLNRSQALDALNAFAEEEALYRVDAKQRLGKDAVNLTEEGKNWFEQKARDYGRDLKGDAARRYSELVGRRRAQLLATLSQHEAAEQRRYSEEQAAATIDTLVNDVSIDPQLVREKAPAVEAQVRALYAHKPPEFIEAEVSKAQGRMYATAIDKYLASHQPSAAREIYAEAQALEESAGRPLFAAETRLQIEKAISSETFAEESQVAAEAIKGAHAGIEAQIAAARKEYSGKLQDEVVKRLTSDFALQERVEAASRRQAARDAWHAIVENETMDALSPMQRASLTGNQLLSMERFVKQRQEGYDPPKSLEVVDEWHSLVNRAIQGDQSAVRSIRNMDIYTKYAGKTSRAHVEQMLEDQSRFIADSQPDPVDVTNAATDSTVFKTWLTGALGPKPTSGDGTKKNREYAQKTASLFAVYEQRLREYKEANNTKYIPDIERRKILGQLEVDMKVEGRGMFGGFFGATQVELEDMSIEEVERFSSAMLQFEELKARIEQSAGRSITDDEARQVIIDNILKGNL